MPTITQNSFYDLHIHLQFLKSIGTDVMRLFALKIIKYKKSNFLCLEHLSTTALPMSVWNYRLPSFTAEDRYKQVRIDSV